MKRILAVLGLVLSALTTLPLAGQVQGPGPEYVPGEVLVEFVAEATAEHRAEARSWVRGARRELLRRRRNGGGELEITRLQSGSVEQAVAALRRHPAVRHAEPNWIYHPLAVSNDPRYTNGSMWGMYGDTGVAPLVNQFGSQANEAWAAGNTGSHSIAIGVIDEGIQIDHPDLAANIWTNPAEAAGVAGVDDDGNGYVDDLHGWDFYNNDNTVYDGTFDDHGTHVAGTIGAVGGNATGVVGVNWNVTLIPAKFLGAGGGSTAGAIKAIDYITDLKTRHGLNIVATNNSWGGGGSSQTLLNAIVRGAKANILFIAAAGNANNNNDATPFYPANYNTTAGAGYDAVIAVANITNTGARSGSSSYGKTTVDLGAPGTNIMSTNPGSSYASLSGTSMATPHVSGAAALYASLLPSVSARRIKEVILASATATPTPSMTDTTVTGGRLNIGAFAAAAPPPPTGPMDLTAVPLSSSQIRLTWEDESDDEDGFLIERCEGAGCTAFTALAYVDEDAITFDDTGLLSNTPYRYQVTAYNRGGSSDPSNAAEATTPARVLTADAGADFSVDEGQAAALNGAQSSHPDDEPLTFGWTQTAGPSVQLTGADTGAPTFTAPLVEPGGATLTFELTVSAEGLDPTTDTVNVMVLNVNAAPSITSSAPPSATEDVQYVYQATSTDDDGPGQTWTVLADDQSCGGTIDAVTGLYAFTPAGPVPPASCVVSIEVCDGGSPNACATETATVTIAAVNDEPVITSAAPATATEDLPYSYHATSTDGDGPGASWSLLPAHTCGGAIDAGGELTFTQAGPAPPASCVVALQVCDGGDPNACATELTTVTITGINDSPVITSVAPAAATEDTPYVYAATVDDADGPAQAWSLLPAHTCGGAIGAGGLFAFTPAGPTPPPNCVIALQVCDGATPNACSSETATVAIAAVNDAPAITLPADISAAATSASGVSVSFTATGADPEDGPLPAACSPASGSVFAIGNTTVTCTVTDAGGAQAGGSFTVTVLDANVPGEMKGDGFVRDDDATYHFTFLAREQASGSERARLSVRIDENGKKKKGKKRDDRFESRSVDFMMFSDDPTVRPGRPARPQVDTVLFSGAGEWNGRTGYRYEVSAQDAGEPGRHRESIRVTISDSAGVVVAAFAGELDGGNVQSRRLRH